MADPTRIGSRAESIDKILTLAKDQEATTVDLKFVDLPGRWHHLSMPAERLDRSFFERGVGFDGSSVPGYSQRATSDMTLVPDPETAQLDPFWERPTLSLICDICHGNGKPLPSDPRGIAKRAETYMRATGIADTASISPEFEFYIFDSVRHRNDVHTCSYRIDSEEAEWNSNLPDGGGTRLSLKEGYHALPPRDRLYLLREEMVRVIRSCGIPVKYQHHEVGGPGQSEIEILFHPLLEAGDVTMMIKYIIRMVADRAGRTASFMPKPLYDAAGNGMHIHQHLFKDGVPLFWQEDGWASLSELALYYIGGLLHHGPALLGLTNPSTNSYKRLVPGFEAPVLLIYGLANRTAAVRIPERGDTPETKRIEFRPPDATCNIYLAMAAMLMAGLDGIQKKIDPRESGFGPFDQNIMQLSESKRRRLKSLPLSLTEVLNALEKDHQFLLEGSVFDEATIRAWIDCKRAEALDVRNRPHPREIALYFDV